MNLNIAVEFDRLLGDKELNALQELLRTHAAQWSSRLSIQVHARDRRPADIAEDGVLARRIPSAASDRGPTYRAMVERYGPGDERFSET